MYGIGRAEAARFERDSRCFERDSKCFERDTKRARAPFRSYICRKHKFPHFRHRGSGAPPDLSFTLLFPTRPLATGVFRCACLGTLLVLQTSTCVVSTKYSLLMLHRITGSHHRPSGKVPIAKFGKLACGYVGPDTLVSALPQRLTTHCECRIWRPVWMSIRCRCRCVDR